MLADCTQGVALGTRQYTVVAFLCKLFQHGLGDRISSCSVSLQSHDNSSLPKTTRRTLRLGAMVHIRATRPLRTLMLIQSCTRSCNASWSCTSYEEQRSEHDTPCQPVIAGRQPIGERRSSTDRINRACSIKD